MASRQSGASDGKIESKRASLRRQVCRSSYSAVCQKLRVSKGALWKFINTAYVPRDPRLYQALGLGELITVTVRRCKDGRFASRRERM